MIDGIKISFRSQTIISDLEKLNEIADIKINGETAEVMVKTATYNTLRFMIYNSGRVVITGSLHKYWKRENHSDFTLGDLIACITDLTTKFQIKPSEARIENVEFGVNVTTLFDPFAFCDHVIAHKGKDFSKYRTEGGIEIGFEATRQQYNLKMYDKGRQYKMTENILRFEVNVTRMVFLQPLSIYYLSDLTKPEVLKGLGQALHRIYFELIISDRVKASDLSHCEMKVYNECSNPKSWPGYEYRQRYKKKLAFESIISKYGLNQWRDKTALLISHKWNMLLAMRGNKRKVLTDPKVK